ncbi:hypothetical protein SAMD00023353_5900070 [Rosellinia necatrix]|uniref:Alcohol acetyltransferase n=1 Tax=Rosellinia necatrix TaxID=77044 RepID=A0A1W2TVH4_ROSNE|nr:hypothetical protein SAMD00023353_5900070 [Rosellinia necatrix]
MAERPLVSLGLLGRYYSARHTLGHYRSVCVAAEYVVPSLSSLETKQGLCDALEHSLQATIRAHSGLCFGLTDKADGSTPLFQQVDIIQQGDVVRYIETDGLDTETSREDLLRRHIETAHAEFWRVGMPAWKAIVLLPSDARPASGTGTKRRDDHDARRRTVYVAFLVHHAIADGLSGLAFHTALMENFATAQERPQWPIVFREPQPTPPVLDDFIDFAALSIPHAQDDDDNDDAQHIVWSCCSSSSGNVTALPSLDSFKSRIRLIALTRAQSARVLATCRDLGVTVTSLLHGAICAALAGVLPYDDDDDGDDDNPLMGVRAATPYSLRRFTGATPREILNHVSYASKYVPGARLRALRRQSALHNGDDDPTAAAAATAAVVGQRGRLAALAREFGDDMRAELARFPARNAWAEIGGVADLVAHCRRRVGRPRGYTYELSNIGALAGISSSSSSSSSPSSSSSARIGLEKLFFTQSGMVTGPALGFNCVSVASGPLTIAITWQEGVVEEDLVDSIARDLSERLIHSIHQD